MSDRCQICNGPIDGIRVAVHVECAPHRHKPSPFDAARAIRHEEWAKVVADCLGRNPGRCRRWEADDMNLQVLVYRTYVGTWHGILQWKCDHQHPDANSARDCAAAQLDAAEKVAPAK